MNQSKSTRVAATRLVCYFIAGLRLGTLLQMAPSMVPALSGAAVPWLVGAAWGLASVTLIGGAVLVLVRGRPAGPRFAVCDVAIACLLLVVGQWTVPVDLRMGTWVGFQLGYTLCVACSLAGVRSRRLWMALLLALVGTEIVYLAPTLEEWSVLPSVLGNVLTVLVLAPLAWLGAGQIIRIGAEADEAREYAAAAAKAEEERRARLAIHNGTAVMGMMLEAGAVHGTDVATHLRHQAGGELARMRAYLRGDQVWAERAVTEQDRTSLAAVVTAVGTEFVDLPITVNADLAGAVELPRRLADDLAAALRSLLLNVRQHARAGRVVIHAADLVDGEGWQLTLHDDGVGYDAAATTLGVGLRDVVVGQLAAYDVEAEISSVPGVGTTVTLTRACSHDDTEGRMLQ